MLRPSPEVDADVISGAVIARGNNGVVVYFLKLAICCQHHLEECKGVS